MMVWKMIILFQGCILRFNVNLPGCTYIKYMLYVCVCVMCIPCYIPYTFFSGLVPQDALESDDSEDVWGTKWGASRFSYGSRIEQCSKMAMFFHPVDLNGIIWSIFDYIYMFFMYPCLYLQLLWVQYKKMHGIGTCTRVFLKCMYEHLVLCIDFIISNGACPSEPSYWFLLGTLQGANISHLGKTKHRLESQFLLRCLCSLEGKTWVDWRISYRLSFCWSLGDMIWKDWKFWSNFPVYI